MFRTSRLAIYDLGPDRYVVCNPLSGDVVLLDAAGAAALQSLTEPASQGPVSPDGGGGPVSPDGGAGPAREVLDALAEKHLLFPSRQAEEEHFARMCTQAWVDFLESAPRNYMFIVNTHCNFACPYCFESESQRGVTSTLTEDQVDAAFRVIDEHTPVEPRVELFGGEPLLPGTENVIDHLLGRLAERGGQATLQTNGFHLQHRLDLLERYRDVVGQLQVTVDGPQPVHDVRRVTRAGRGTFAQVVAGIDAVAASDLPLRVNVRTNVDRANVGRLGELAAFFAERGWTRDERFTFTAAPVDNRSGSLSAAQNLLGWDELFDSVFPLCTDCGGGPFDLSVFKVLGVFRSALGAAAQGCSPPAFRPRVNYCEAVALKLFVFHPDDHVYPCPEIAGTPAHALGTYRPWLRLDQTQVARWRRQTVLDREDCHDCVISTLCGGGCALAALTENGTLTRPACEGAPQLVRAWFSLLHAALP